MNKTGLPKDYISNAQLNAYKKCPQFYKRKYVLQENETSLFKPEWLIGRSFHSYAKNFIMQKYLMKEEPTESFKRFFFYKNFLEAIEKKEIMVDPLIDDQIKANVSNANFNLDFETLEEIAPLLLLDDERDLLFTGYTEISSAGKSLKRPPFVQIYDNLIEKFEQNICNVILEQDEVLQVEQNTRFNFNRYGKEYTLYGIPDLVLKRENKIIVPDWKTTSKSPNADNIKTFQDRIYSYGIFQTHGSLPLFQYAYFSYSKAKAEVSFNLYQIDYQDVSDVEIDIFEIIKGIKNNVFPKYNYQNWFCSSSWCPFYSSCQEKEDKNQVERIA